MINKLAYLTANYLSKFITDTTNFSQIIATRKKKEYRQLLISEVIDVMAYSLKAIYGEIVKMILILIFASFLHILLPTLIISIVFSTLRLLAGGVHMGTFFTCLGMGTVVFIGGGLLVHNIIDISFINQNILYLILIEGVLNLYLINKYAPRDTPNKPITDKKEIKMFNTLSFVFVSMINNVLIFLSIYHQYNIIVLSIIYGLLLEVFTITPIGVKTFNYIENKLNKLFNIKEVQK